MHEDDPLDEKLPYPTKPMYFVDGTSVEEFIIPEEDRELVLEQLYPFAPVPKLTDEMYDLHADKTFFPTLNDSMFPDGKGEWFASCV